MFKAIQLLAAACLLTMASGSWANPQSASRSLLNDSRVLHHCDYIPNQHLCRITPGCEWNYTVDACQDVGNGGGMRHGARCYQIYNYHRCVNTHNCYWDRYSDRCLSYGGGGGGGGHHRCGEIYSYHRCNNTPGCIWDRYEDRCRRNW